MISGGEEDWLSQWGGSSRIHKSQQNIKFKFIPVEALLKCPACLHPRPSCSLVLFGLLRRGTSPVWVDLDVLADGYQEWCQTLTEVHQSVNLVARRSLETLTWRSWFRARTRWCQSCSNHYWTRKLRCICDRCCCMSHKRLDYCHRNRCSMTNLVVYREHLTYPCSQAHQHYHLKTTDQNKYSSVLDRTCLPICWLGFDPQPGL